LAIGVESVVITVFFSEVKSKNIERSQKERYVQGGAMNHGLLFAGPPPPPFGGCERKD
jgi:hypothetical protein